MNTNNKKRTASGEDLENFDFKVTAFLLLDSSLFYFLLFAKNGCIFFSLYRIDCGIQFK